MRLFSKWRDRYIKEPIAEQAAAFIDKAQYNLAIRTLEEGFDVDPDYPAFLWLRAEIANKTQDWESALACYEDLEEILERDTPAALFEARGNVFYFNQAYENAIAAFVQAERKGVKEVNLFFKRGVSLLKIRGYDLALKDLLKVEKNDPDYPSLGLYLAEVYFFLGKYRTSTAYFRRAAQKLDLTENQFSMLAEAYWKMKAYKKASIVLSTLIHNYAVQPHYLNKRAACYLHLGEVKSAIEDLDKAIDMDNQFVDALSNRGYAYLVDGRIEEGKIDLKKALTSNPSHAETYRALGYYHILKNEPEMALRKLEKAFIINEKLSLLYYFKGLALLEMGEKKEAKKALYTAASRGEEEAIKKLKELEE